MSDDNGLDPSEERDVEVRREGGQVVAVHVPDHWQDRLTPGQLLLRARAAYLAGATAAPHWHDQINLAAVPLEQMGELVACMRDAKAEDPGRETAEIRSRHLRTVWFGPHLMQLDGDRHWLTEAPRQAIADELLEVLQTPEEAPAGPAVRRLLAMMGER